VALDDRYRSVVFYCNTSLVFNTEILLDVTEEVGHEVNVTKIEYTLYSYLVNRIQNKIVA
jgi:hypothetical protein